jgi:hypothetical protein
MECNLEYFGNIHQNFDNVDFADFVFKHEWLADQKAKEKKQEEGNTNNPGMLSLNEMLSKMNTGKDD